MVASAESSGADIGEAGPIALHEYVRRFRQEAAARFRADRLIGQCPAMRLARRLEPGLRSYRLDALVQALELRAPDAPHFHRSVADVNHTVALWHRLHATFHRHTGVASPPAQVLSKLMRTPVKQAPRYLASLVQ